MTMIYTKSGFLAKANSAPTPLRLSQFFKLKLSDPVPLLKLKRPRRTVFCNAMGLGIYRLARYAIAGSRLSSVFLGANVEVLKWLSFLAYKAHSSPIRERLFGNSRMPLFVASVHFPSSGRLWPSVSWETTTTHTQRPVNRLCHTRSLLHAICV